MLLNLPFSLFFFCLILIVSNKCGDFVIDAGETCDDGNTRSGDGCSSDCRVEYNYKCYNNTQKYSVCYISKPFSANLNYIPSTSPFELFHNICVFLNVILLYSFVYFKHFNSFLELFR